MVRNENLRLKSLETTDLPDRLRWLNDPEVTRYFTNLGSTPLTFRHLQNWYEQLNPKNEIHFAVYTIDGHHIGGAQLKSLEWKNRSAEFGIFIGEAAFRGQNLGKQLTQLLISYGFNSLNLHRIWLRVDEANHAALKCYQASGFKEEGRLRDEVFRAGAYHSSIIMSILNFEWRGE